MPSVNVGQETRRRIGLLGRGSQPRGRRRATITAIAVVCAVAFGLSHGSATTATPSRAWLNKSMPTSARVNALLNAMTLPEKVGQMDQQLVDNVTDPNSANCNTGNFGMPNPACEQKFFVDQNVGSVLAGGTDNPPDTTGMGGAGNTGLDWANEYNMIQSYAVAHSRLHIPRDLRRRRCPRLRPSLAGAAVPAVDRDGRHLGPAAAQAGGAATANALRATGWVWDFAPVQDLSRDNRWGRTYETWAEEPALSAAMGGANVRGCRRPRRQRAQCRRPRSSTSPATRSPSTATTATRPCSRSATSRADPAVLRRWHRRRCRIP